MADNNKVTIDATWFAELWKIANEADKVCEDCIREKCGECKVVKERDELRKELEEHNKNCRNRNRWLNADYKALEKERDELRAKLDAAEVDRETYKDRAEAAERCIDEIYKNYNSAGLTFQPICDIIRAYRAAKEAK